MRTVDNPPNPYQSSHVEWLGAPPQQPLELYEEDARSILSRNDSPDLPFSWSLNPYRGCEHACAYCYARPSHEYLGFGAGSDFERRIVVKRNAPELLQRALRRKSWAGEFLAFSGITDCYQAVEASYELTRRCLQVCLRHRNPVAIVTKSMLIRRDIALLQELQKKAGLVIHMSIAFADETVARALEPGAPSLRRRWETMSALADAGLQVGVLVAPIVPGLNDADLAEILQRSRDHGARHAGHAALRLPGSVQEVFLKRLEASLDPARVRRVRSRILEMREGRWNDSRFGQRMRGAGPYWDSLEQLFHIQCARLGLHRSEVDAPPLLPPRVRRPVQGNLFSDPGRLPPQS